MTFGLKTKDGVVLMFTSTTSITESHSGSLPSHPLEDGSSINDHSVSSSPQMNVTGFFTKTDFNAEVVDNYLFMESILQGIPLQYTGAGSLNGAGIAVTGKPDSALNKLLPEGLALFTQEAPPTVEVFGDASPTSLEAVKLLLIGWKESAKSLEALFFDDGVLTSVIKDMAISDLSFNESPDSGEALYTSLSLTQVKFVSLGKKNIPKLTWKEIDLTDKGANTKGQQQGSGTGVPGSSKTEQPPAGEEEVDKCASALNNGRSFNIINCTAAQLLGRTK